SRTCPAPRCREERVGMKRYRVKAAGLGLALWAGYLHGEDAPRPANPPALLPAAVRSSEWSAGPAASDTVWLPARTPSLPPSAQPTVTIVPSAAVLPPIVVPTVSPKKVETLMSPLPPGDIASLGSLPEIP